MVTYWYIWKSKNLCLSMDLRTLFNFLDPKFRNIMFIIVSDSISWIIGKTRALGIIKVYKIVWYFFFYSRYSDVIYSDVLLNVNWCGYSFLWNVEAPKLLENLNTFWVAQRTNGDSVIQQIIPQIRNKVMSKIKL